MEKFLYLWIKWLMNDKGLNYKYYSLFNNQITDVTKDEGIQFPAILFEPTQIVNDYFGSRVLQGEFQFNLHIYTESYGVIRDEDITEDNALQHFDYINEVVRVIDNNQTDMDSYTGFTLMDDQEDYAISTVNLFQKRYLTRYKSLNYTQLTFRARFLDLSIYNNGFDALRTLNGLSGDTSADYGIDYNFGLK